MKNFEIIFYEAINGECPIEEFLNSLDKKMRAKLIGMMEILEEKGNMLREPYSKSLGEGIFELRCKFGNDITRVLYFFIYERKNHLSNILWGYLTNGFIKKTRKTPIEQIQTAKARRKDFLERMEKNENV